jgi:DNA-binding Lrp family transcriptional regulator
MSLSLAALDNLVRIGQIKPEPSNDAEVRRMLAMARTRLADAQLDKLSAEGRFTSAYNAAHRKRNLAEYEGFLEVEASDIAELCAVVSDLIDDVARVTHASTSTPDPKR